MPNISAYICICTHISNEAYNLGNHFDAYEGMKNFPWKINLKLK